MKSITVQQPGGLDNLIISEKPAPTPGPEEILVRWHATSLNFHDYLVAIGAIPVAEGRIPMSDGAGEIIAVGDQVDQWRIGDKVMSLFFPNWIEGKASLEKTSAISGETVDGYITEQSCLPASAVTKIPEGYSFAEAATLPCAALTAWRALMVEGKLQKGEKVLIQGTGGMSIFAMQLAKAVGARIFATTSSEEKADRLKAMGAEVVINYKTDERWGRTIYKISGDGVDHVLDVGGGSTMQHSIEAAAMNGHITSIGILGEGRKGEITFPKFFFKHLQMTGIAVGNGEMQKDMVKALNQWQIRPIIDRSFAFDQLADAFRYQESGVHFGKIILEF